MKLALSEISTVNATFETDVVAYAAAGFDGIGIWEMKLPDDDTANRAALRDARLGVANCIPTVPSILPLGLPGMGEPANVDERVQSLCASVRRLSTFEPASVLVITGPTGDRDADDARRIVIDGLREVGAAARTAGVRLGLEPIHPNQDDTVSFVHTVAEAVALLDEAGLGDVGLMADTYNLWHEPPEALAAVAGRLTGLHVADDPGTGIGERALPGESGSRSAEHVAALRAAGWDGYLDVEIFSTPDGFWALPAEEAARRAYAAIARL